MPGNLTFRGFYNPEKIAEKFIAKVVYKMEQHTVTCEDQVITFLLVRKNVKNVNLKVRPDSTVVVSAGSMVPREFIEQLIREKARWISKTRNRFEERHSRQVELQYISGEIIYYLGRQYRLMVLPTKNREKVFIDGDDLALLVRDGSDFTRREKLIKLWYKEQAKIIFNDSLERMYPKVAGYGIDKPSITIRAMKTRWGSCSWKKRKITLNTELMKTPQSCIDYLVLHELAHFKHRNHDTAFYAFLSSIMPEWKEHKLHLRSFMTNSC
jgi:predicted metal-dependent hydrolase